jgi:hypothetical protein
MAKSGLVATDRNLGDCFDDARLDTLLLAISIQWGTRAQYAANSARGNGSVAVPQLP